MTVAVSLFLKIAHPGPEDATPAELPGRVEKYAELPLPPSELLFEVDIRHGVHEIGADEGAQEHVVSVISVRSSVPFDRRILEEQQDEAHRVVDVERR